jgi:hypothetical protein
MRQVPCTSKASKVELWTLLNFSNLQYDRYEKPILHISLCLDALGEKPEESLVVGDSIQETSSC